MAPAPSDSAFSHVMHALQTGAHALAPAGTDRFEWVAMVSLLGYLLFAVVALHYALKPWAEKAMCASLLGATAASLLLRLSLRQSPSYAGEGPLWKFVSMSQYLPWAVISVGCLYGLYRLGSRCRAKRR